MDLKQRAERLIAAEDWGHSEFQIEHFIVGKAGPTDYGMLKQCRREIRGRVAALTPPKSPRWARVLRFFGLGGRVVRSDAPGSQATRELRRLVTLAEAAERRLKAVYGPTLPVAELDAEMWQVRIARMALLEMLATGFLSTNSIETIMALPRPLRDPITDCIGRVAGRPNFGGQLSGIETATAAFGTPAEGGSNTLRTGLGRGSKQLRSDGK